MENEVKAINAVWLSVDKMAAGEMMLAYLRDCKIHRYFEEVQLILWGPTVSLAAKDQDIALQIELLQSVGVKVVACRACANLYGVVDTLIQHGIPVEPMGFALSEIIKSKDGLIFI